MTVSLSPKVDLSFTGKKKMTEVPSRRKSAVEFLERRLHNISIDFK